MTALGLTRAAVGLIFAALVAFYAITMPANTVEAIDGYDYALAAETIALDTTHDTRSILFHKFNRVVYLASKQIKPDIRAYELLRWTSIVAAAGAVILFARLMVVGFQLAPSVAWLGAGLLGVSYGFWRYGTEVEVYASSTTLILAVLNLVIDAERREPYGPFGLLPAGWLAGIAASFYQPTAIALFIAMPVLLLSARSFVRFAIYGATGTFVVMFVLVAAFFAREGYLPDAITLLAFINERGGEFPAPPLSLWTFVQGALAVGHDLVTSHWLYAFDAVNTWLARNVPQRFYRFEETIYAATQSPSLARIALYAFGLLIISSAFAVASAVRGWRGFTHIRLSLFMVAWFVTHAAITMRLDPSTEEPWIISTTPLIALLTIYVIAPACAAAGPRSVVAVVASLFVVNYAGGIGLYANGHNERRRIDMAYLEANAKPGDVLVASSREHSDWLHARYRLGLTVVYATGSTARTFGIDLRRDIIAPTGALLAAFAKDGRQVFALERALYPDVRIKIREDQAALDAAISFANTWRPHATVVAATPFGRIYRLSPPTMRTD
jgi:hypothetical protein